MTFVKEMKHFHVLAIYYMVYNNASATRATRHYYNFFFFWFCLCEIELEMYRCNGHNVMCTHVKRRAILYFYTTSAAGSADKFNFFALLPSIIAKKICSVPQIISGKRLLMQLFNVYTRKIFRL